MKLIITGASGFVGKNFIKIYGSEMLISGINLRVPFNIVNDLIYYDAILHLAGKAHDTNNSSDEKEYFYVNRDLTIQLFDQFLNSEIRDFIYFSSVKAVADDLDDILTEETIPNPKTPYGKSKLEAENYLLSKTLPEGKRLFIIRPCMIHGPGNKGNLNLLFKIVEKGLPWPLAKYHNLRSFVNIDNLCFLLKEILVNPTIKAGIYNFADDRPISTNRLIELIALELNNKPRFLKIPKLLLKYLAKIGDFIPFPLNSERLKKLSESYVVSNDKIKNALSITNLPIDVEKGLTSTIGSFISHQK